MTHWLTTGNTYTDTDADGNEVLEHHIHDMEFVDGKIKKINVYSRAKTME
jgi:predicted RNase H-like HicB family nuclease